MNSPAVTSTVLSHVVRATRAVRLCNRDVQGLGSGGGRGFWGNGVVLPPGAEALGNRSCDAGE